MPKGRPRGSRNKQPYRRSPEGEARRLEALRNSPNNAFFKKRMHLRDRLPELVAAYESGMTLRQVGELFGCSGSAVFGVFVENNVPTRRWRGFAEEGMLTHAGRRPKDAAGHTQQGDADTGDTTTVEMSAPTTARNGTSE